MQNSSAPLRVLVLGGTGFIGRHAVAALHAAGAQVWIGSRYPARHSEDYKQTFPGVNFRQVRFEHLTHSADWHAMLDSVDVVINCVGILRQRLRESYEVVHHLAPAALAAACAQLKIRCIHTSALGLHEGAKSRFLSSKLLGERAMLNAGADVSIVRPSLLDGVGGFGARWLRALACSPVQFVPRGARGRIAAMSCTDLGAAFVALAHLPNLSAHREVELGGMQHFSYAEYLQVLRSDYKTTQAWQLGLPDWVTRLGAHVCDLLHFSPFSYGHWLLLQRDNIPQPNRLPELLGRAPHAIVRPRD